MRLPEHMEEMIYSPADADFIKRCGEAYGADVTLIVENVGDHLFIEDALEAAYNAGRDSALKDIRAGMQMIGVK